MRCALRTFVSTKRENMLRALASFCTQLQGGGGAVDVPGR